MTFPPFPDQRLVERYIERRQRTAVSEVSFGPRDIELVEPDKLPAAQEGYGGIGWEPSWLVIAIDWWFHGDPLFTDVADEQLPVFTAGHGAGRWDPVQIADSFEGYVGALEAVASIEKDPLAEPERKRVLDRIRDLNPRSDADYWEEWLAIADEDETEY